MKNFDYRVPTRVLFGKGEHLRVGEIIKGYGYKKILLHYGRGSVKAGGLYQEIVGSLNASGVAFVELGGVEPNPKLRFVKEGAALCRAEGCELVLAVGGGSVIDSAKAIAMTVPQDGDPWDFWARKRTPTAALPIGTIVTIAAAGSETSSSTVLTNADIPSKLGINSELVRPVFSILNPELTYTVDRYQTGCGVVDIMMHTLERYFCDAEPAELTDRLAEGLLKSVISAGKIAIDQPRDYEARATLMWASSLSHNDLTGLGRAAFLACHKLEHALTGRYDFVAHGAGLSVIFPAWAKYVYRANPERFCQYACRVWDIDYAGTERTALAGVLALEAYFASLGMPTRLSAFGIEGLCVEELADACTAGGTVTLPGYREIGKNEVMEIFELAR